jgi:hypothetical protein
MDSKDARNNRAFLVFFAALAAAACAEQRAPIVRVQPDGVNKTLFVGALDDPTDDPEFFMRTTLVDAPMGAADGLFVSTDAQPTVRVKFEITEKLLVARLTYELIQDSDHRGARRTNDGQPVAAYAIAKHFDVRHDYNPTTGEELNVLLENDTDRPWFQRDMMRVDWSKNLITDAYDLDAVSELGIDYGIKFDPVAYYVNDPQDPNIPVFDLEHGYFDITNKVLASPEIIHDEELGDYPACFLEGRFPAENCNPSELVLRQSFMRVEDHDYEPVDYDGTRMDMFGYFTDDRYGYDRRYGVVDDKWHRFATRWNIWEKSHVDPVVSCATVGHTTDDPHADADNDGTEDACASVGRGSRCDEFRGECTIPYRDRHIKTIVWHTNPGFQDDLFEGAARALDAWSEAIRVAVVAARLAECRRTHEESCEQAMAWPEHWSDDYSPPVGDSGPSEVPKIFVLCHNPVDPDKGDDPAICGPEKSSPRLGDLRYNFINMVASPQINSPWGIMVDAEDPLTGEKISGSVNEWSAVLDIAASTLADLLALLNGEIQPDAFIKGHSVAEWVAANQPSGPAARGSAMSADEIASRKGAFDSRKMKALQGVKKRRPGIPRKLAIQERARALADRAPAIRNGALLQRLRRLQGTPVEARLASPEMVQAAGYNPNGALSEEIIHRASPLGRLNPAFRKQLTKKRMLSRAVKHSCRLGQDVAPDNLLGLARAAKERFPSPDPNDKEAVLAHRRDVWNWARQQYSASVLAHELGHSMGLRHNFAGSFDAINYHPQYWQLRTHNGEVTRDCPDGNTDGASCVGPRWRDPITEEEIEGNIGRFAMTSVMDYPGDQNHDMQLLGKYDRAAMRFGYGNLADVWSAPDVSVDGSGQGKIEAYLETGFASPPGLFGVFDFPTPNPDEGTRPIHYSQYQNQFHLLEGCEPSSAPDAVLGTKCKEHDLDVVDYRDLTDFAPDPRYAIYDWAITKRAVDKDGRVRRGYLFSSDEFADTGNVPSYSYDAGADAYEQVRFLESAYENRYIVDAFRRNRVEFNSFDVLERMQGHYLDNAQSIAKTFAFAAVLEGDPSEPSADLLKDGTYGPLGMAASVAFDMFARMLTRPEPGFYCDPDNSSCPVYNPTGVDESIYGTDTAPLPGEQYAFAISLGDGRYVHNDFDYSQGYWWSDYQTQVGAYYEKVYATYYLAEAFDDFVSNSKEDFTDGRYKNLNFASIYPDQMRRLYGALLSGDLATYSPWVDTVSSGGLGSKLVYPTWHAETMSAAPRAGAKLVNPNWGWNEQLYAMVFGAIFFPTDWSNAWINEARIAVLGRDQVDWPASETFAFYNPLSGMTYRAHSSGTETVMGKKREISIGARMLEWANHLVYIAYRVRLDDNGDPVLNPDGTPKLILDAEGHPQLDPETVGSDVALQQYVENIDLFRQLTSEYLREIDDP